MSKLTIKSITNAKVGDVIYDDIVPGLHVKVQTKRASFYLYFRTRDRKECRPKIGDYGVMNIEQARKIARDWLVQNANGQPIKQLQPTVLLTVQALYEEWCKVHLPTLKKNSQRVVKAYWTNSILPNMAHYRLSELDRYHIADLFDKISVKTPVMANRVVSTLSNALDMAEGWELPNRTTWRTPNSNPCKSIKKNKENKRMRYLKPEEMQRLGAVLLRWEECGGWQRKSSRYIRLLVMTGARRSEISHALREWIDFDRQLLCLPDSKTGAKIIALPNAAIKLLRQIIVETPTSPWICHGRKPSGPMTQTYYTWGIIKTEAKLADIKLHDLRHSFASVGLSMLGYNLKQVGTALGHASVQSTERYAHLMIPEHVAISDAISCTIEQLMQPAKEVA